MLPLKGLINFFFLKLIWATGFEILDDWVKWNTVKGFYYDNV